MWHYSSRTREFQKAQVGSNEKKKYCRDGLGTQKWSVVSDVVGGFASFNKITNICNTETGVKPKKPTAVTKALEVVS